MTDQIEEEKDIVFTPSGKWKPVIIINLIFLILHK